jgi:hypothetical protein
MSSSGDPTNPLPDRSHGSLHYEFFAETEFWDALTRMIRSAPIRTAFYERAILHQLDRILEAWRTGADLDQLPVRLIDGFGLMISEKSYPDVPECLVSFEYAEPLTPGERVTFFMVRAALELDPVEDYSDDP